ncbi:hypothetical protein [Desulfovibrio cuneatus]|uniref:hypothetical protein n=1 Tax=Desulfovibrio cuneatus TaxID=159728 RepID=UPI0003F83F89|nr:hypothetical protein [Desulfovibrio cuneatus]
MHVSTPAFTSAAQLHLTAPTPSLNLILQSGVLLPCRTGICLHTLFAHDLAVPAEVLQRITVFFLDGKPVDNLETAFAHEGCRIALAAGLPGAAGLAMRLGSPLAGLRPGITHLDKTHEAVKEHSYITLALFSLSMPMLAPHFLAQGVYVTPAQLEQYVSPESRAHCTFTGSTGETGTPGAQANGPLASFLPTWQAMPKEALVRLTVAPA